MIELMSDGVKPLLRGKISQVKRIKDRLMFPVSWFQKQEYCEYQIYLENVKKITVKPTRSMTTGKMEHKRLHSEFMEKAKPSTFEELLVKSVSVSLLSRELRVDDIEHGVYGYIDEIWLTPEEFFIIDDKPGVKAYSSSIHQCFGYCLAFNAVIKSDEKRRIIAALRERGTDNIIWQSVFDQSAKETISSIADHIHNLLIGREDYRPCNNPQKCRSCRFISVCDKAVSQ